MNTEFLNKNEQKRKVSQQMRAVLTILNSNEELMSRVQSHINLANENIRALTIRWGLGQLG